jgi:3-oxoacyl-[acyl-carrier protein] reductase
MSSSHSHASESLARSSNTDALLGTVVVLGGTGAIGQVLCRTLSAQGYSVHFTYGNREAAARELAESIAASGGSATYQRIRLGEADTLDELGAHLAGITGVSAAVYAAGPDIEQPYIVNITPAQWMNILQQDVMAFLKFAHIVLPRLRENNGGSLLAITTVAVRRHASRDALSSVPKAAVEAAVRGIAREEGRYGIRANCVAPGMLATGMGQRILDMFQEKSVEQIRESIPLKHFGAASDIADAAAFLLSSKARYISGQSLCVDGGWSV